MKPRRSIQTNQALTLMEVLVIVVIVAVLAAMLLPALAAAQRKAQRLWCVGNLAQIGLAYRVWEGDHSGQYPMQATVTNNGTLELLSASIPASQLVLWNFTVMSNILVTPKLLHCPADAHPMATDFASRFSNTNISYFVSPHAAGDYPQMILTGDDNLALNGIPINSGLIDLPTNVTVTWTGERHHNGGNINLADGSVQQIGNDGLQQTLQQTGTNTTRLAIP